MNTDTGIDGYEVVPDKVSITLDGGDRHGRKPKAKKPKNAEQETLRQLQGWWDEAREFHAENRRQQLIDVDFYDHHQFSTETAYAMLDRGQFPSVYNLIAVAIDWIIGTERRTRIEGKVHPRGPEDVESAQAKQQVFKYVDDVNQAGFQQSEAFANAIKAGVGWLEECVVKDASREPIAIRWADWKEMWWDPFSKRKDLDDARYITRRKWIDLDYAAEMFPDHAARLDGMAKAFTEVDLSDSDDLADMPAMFLNRDLRQFDAGYRLFGSTSTDQNYRRRLPINETWFKRPAKVQRMVSLDPDLNDLEFDPAKPSHTEAVGMGLASLTDAVESRIFVAFWVPGCLLKLDASPYRHNRYPFTPIWCKREDRTGLPYGYIRGMRDAQMDYNKRRAKALWHLSVNRVIVEAGAVDAADEDDFKDEASRPDAFLRVAKGALVEGRIRFEQGQELAASQVQLGEQAKQHILEGSGVTRENLGQEGQAKSGIAISLKQSQGAVATAESFDNLRLANQISGQKRLANIEQFMSMPKRLRILGPRGKLEWLLVNEPAFDPETGEVFFQNDLTAQQADYVVDQQDFRETMRMQMAEALFDVISKLPPELQINMLDLALELTDLPNRDELVARIRKLSGQGEPGEPLDEAQMAAKQAEQDAQQRASDIEMQERSVRMQKEMAHAAKLNAEAKRIGIQGKREALDTAGLVSAAVPLAPAADRLWAGTAPTQQG